MKAAGITAEYNPLHNGHIYHLHQSKALSGADAVVVAMSGDYVQRGEPAILDKWTRAEHALRCGADLVIEIPVLYCLGNAGQYAAASVSLLEATGKVTQISFGSESGSTDDLVRVAGNLSVHSAEIEKKILEKRHLGFSYPAARELAYAAVSAELKATDPESDPEIDADLKILRNPNDILAVEYIRAMKYAQPLAVRREGTGYSDPYDERFPYQSASALRAQFFSGGDLKRYIPECTARDLAEKHPTGPETDRWFDFLKYAVLSDSAEVIEDCPSGGEGLANLMKSVILTEEKWNHFVRRVHSKRYTYSRISRLCMQTLLGITRNEYAGICPGYIRVLGFNETGRALLGEMKREESASLPVITNINKEADQLDENSKKLLALDIHASDIYNLACGLDANENSDHIRRPVMV